MKRSGCAFVLNRRHLETVFRRVTVNERGCWITSAPTNSSGYPTWKFRGLHRLSHEWFVGPIPAGFDIDHLCNDKRCINPAHLEAVTHTENIRRYAARRTHCPQGHDLSVTGAWWGNGHGRRGRRCRVCHAASSNRAYHSRRRIEATRHAA